MVHIAKRNYTFTTDLFHSLAIFSVSFSCSALSAYLKKKFTKSDWERNLAGNLFLSHLYFMYIMDIIFIFVLKTTRTIHLTALRVS